MRVPDLVAHNPVFLVVKDKGQEKVVGTAFLMTVRSDTRPEVSHGYLITARHCVEMANQYGSLFVRVNRRIATGLATPYTEQVGDAELFEIEHPNWVYHEEHVNDVAVLPGMPSPDESLFVAVEPESCATADTIAREAMGIGDELIVVGLFTSHYGRTRNRPIVRTGTIAAMPDEPLEDRNSGELYDAYLAEIRSVGGLSGSPVWIVIHPGRVKPGSVERENRLHFYLLGLIRGHWTKSDIWLSDCADSEEALNTGIAIVTPIQKVIDIIESEALVKERRRVKGEEKQH
jgi:hypothetical protein